ncbi:MAG: SusC/RagA family TonB-linked outer membrane protein [Dysgonamonadaceae bacterium]|jgi:TonB-linked SusC/RagA family outer membrane protein|nr:SusC/RagA family TonB-linked outer membrane protein [Dysgonamonadaceae bacterium]
MKGNLILFFNLLFFSVTSFAQTTVTGRVISETDREPIIGASVQVKEHKTVGTITDFEGNFSLSVPAGSKTLVFSYLGMQTKEAAIKPRMEIVLSEDSKMLTEVVVTGMLNQDKRLFTGATTKIDASKAKLDGVADISRSLEGRVAGVSVQNVSGTFGTAPKIRVRGATSIYGSSRPLWVVDGVIMEDAVDISADQLSSGDAITLISSAIAGINADDIESFQILKDGSATSIYGARAMAGVVVITTKKGKAGASTLNYTGEFTYRLKPSYRDFNIANSQEQMGIYKEMEAKGWLEFAQIANSASSGVYGRMYHLVDTYDRETGTYGIPFTETAMNAYLREAEYRNTDWFGLLFNNSIQQNHAISISNGTERARSYVSMSIMHDPGWELASGVNRYTLNANVTYDLSKTLQLTLLSNDSYRKQKAPGTLNQDVDVVRGEVRRNFDINPYSFALNTSRTMDPNDPSTRNFANFNIFQELENNYLEFGITDVKFQGELGWKPIKGLELKSLVSYRHQNVTREHFIKDHSNQANAYRAGIIPRNSTIRDINPFLYTDPDDANAVPETVLPQGGIYKLFLNRLSSLDFRASAQYSSTINDIHIFNLFGGTEINSTDRTDVYFEGWGFVYDNGGIPFIEPRLFKQQSEENSDYYSNTWTCRRNVAFFSQGSYSFKGRYVLSLTGRYEGTNRLGKARQSRWLPTWNIGTAWNIHEESWFANQILSHATLRASFSLTADAGPAFLTNSTPIYRPFKPWRPLSSVQELGLELADIENSELTYEKKHEFNVGADLGFLDNRINLSADVYKRNNYDLIGKIYTPGLGGFTLKYANVATMESHGVELTLSTTNIRTKDFTWTTDFTFSNARTKITALESRSQVIGMVQGVGLPLQGYPQRAVFSIPFIGLNDEGLPQFINQDNEETISDMNFQEFDKIGFLVYEGPVDPPITGGFGNLLNYKRFRLNVFLTYSFGNVIRLDPYFRAAYTDVMSMPKEFKNRWVLPGDEDKTNIPAIASRRQVHNDQYLSYAYNSYNYSTQRIAKGDFIRLQEVSLTYDLPNAIAQKMRVSNASVKIQTTKLFLLYADKKLNGQDPEFFNSGGVATPMPKQVTFTLRLGI